MEIVKIRITASKGSQLGYMQVGKDVSPEIGLRVFKIIMGIEEDRVIVNSPEPALKRFGSEKRKGPKTCGRCGIVGHTAWKCPQRPGNEPKVEDDSQPNVALPSDTIDDIKDRLREGEQPETIANETGASVFVVGILKRGMEKSGEL